MLNTDTLLKKLLATQEDIASQLERLNKNLESGTINIRTHSPLCIALPGKDYTLAQMEAASSFLAASIKSGALVLPGKGEPSNVVAAEAGGER